MPAKEKARLNGEPIPNAVPVQGSVESKASLLKLQAARPKPRRVVRAFNDLRLLLDGKTAVSNLKLPEAKAPKPIFVLHLAVGPNCPDATRALRQLLKIALRRFGLRCISVEQAQP